MRRNLYLLAGANIGCIKLAYHGELDVIIPLHQGIGLQGRAQNCVPGPIEGLVLGRHHRSDGLRVCVKRHAGRVGLLVAARGLLVRFDGEAACAGYGHDTVPIHRRDSGFRDVPMDRAASGSARRAQTEGITVVNRVLAGNDGQGFLAGLLDLEGASYRSLELVVAAVPDVFDSNSIRIGRNRVGGNRHAVLALRDGAVVAVQDPDGRGGLCRVVIPEGIRCTLNRERACVRGNVHGHFPRAAVLVIATAGDNLIPERVGSGVFPFGDTGGVVNTVQRIDQISAHRGAVRHQLLLIAGIRETRNRLWIGRHARGHRRDGRCRFAVIVDGILCADGVIRNCQANGDGLVGPSLRIGELPLYLVAALGNALTREQVAKDD